MEEGKAAVPGRHGLRRLARSDRFRSRKACDEIVEDDCSKRSRWWFSLFSFFCKAGARLSFRLCAVPVSLIGTFVLFPLFGFSINTLSLFGLVLAIGLVVDDAIVVVEAVEHHIEKG